MATISGVRRVIAADQPGSDFQQVQRPSRVTIGAAGQVEQFGFASD